MFNVPRIADRFVAQLRRVMVSGEDERGL